MEGNFKHHNAYSGYDEVYSIIENFRLFTRPASR